MNEKNIFENNPIGHLQERMQKEGNGLPKYTTLSEVGAHHQKEFIIRVTLPSGLKVEGTATSKKQAKHNAARAMLDILDGRAKAINDDVRESIDLGLKALRGDSEKPQTEVQQFAASGVGISADSIADSLADSVFLENMGPVRISNSISWESLTTPPSLLEQNQGLKDESKRRENRKVGAGQARKKKETSAKYDHPHIMENFLQPLGSWLKELILEKLFAAIDKKRLEQEPLAEEICKLCNLVFISEKMCNQHKKGDFHERVQEGEFPGHGGFHCFLCWVNYLQPEGLLNHVARLNHQARAKKEGVLKIWMEPVPIAPTWDTIKMFQDLRELEEEEKRRRRRRRSSSSTAGSRRRSSSQQQRKPRNIKGRSPDAAIKAGVSGDWRVGRQKTFQETEKLQEREHRQTREADRRLRLKRERDERMRQEWDRKMRERAEMRERQKAEDRRRRASEEAYWRKQEEREWRDWKVLEKRRWMEELAWRAREDVEWREHEERIWRQKEAELRHGESSFFDSLPDDKSRRRGRQGSSGMEEEEGKNDSEPEEGEYRPQRKKRRDIKHDKFEKGGKSAGRSEYNHDKGPRGVRGYSQERGPRRSRSVYKEHNMSERTHKKGREYKHEGENMKSRQYNVEEYRSIIVHTHEERIHTSREPDLRDLLRKKRIKREKSGSRSMSRSSSRSSSSSSTSTSSSSTSTSSSSGSRSPPSKKRKKKHVLKGKKKGGEKFNQTVIKKEKRVKKSKTVKKKDTSQLIKVKNAILDILDEEIDSLKSKS